MQPLVADVEPKWQSAERAARNEVAFRHVNESLEEKREELELGGRTPFLCECGDESCTELISLTLSQYEHVRSRPTWFVVADEHDTRAETVEQHDGYVIVSKGGVAGAIASEENPRG